MNTFIFAGRLYTCRGCGTEWPDAAKNRETQCPQCGIHWG